MTIKDEGIGFDNACGSRWWERAYKYEKKGAKPAGKAGYQIGVE